MASKRGIEDRMAMSKKYTLAIRRYCINNASILTKNN